MAFKTPGKEEAILVGSGYVPTAMGFFGAHAINAVVKKQYSKELPWWGSGLLGLAIGMTPLLFVKKGQDISAKTEALKGLCYGVGTYQVAKSISQLADAKKGNDPTADYFLPESIRQGLKTYFPTLGGTDDFPAYSYYNRGTLDLPVLNSPGMQIASMGNLNYSQDAQANLLGMGNPSLTPAQKAML